MPTFGSYETDREVYTGSSYTVFSAKKIGDPTTPYAVKLFYLQPEGLDVESSAELAPLISDIEHSAAQRIAVQQKAAEISKFISPVLETGRDERGVWYATRFFPRSVNKIISGRVALPRRAIENIVSAITQGALDLKQTSGRSHGEILPSNIQISRTERITGAEVVLSDPLPGPEKEARIFEIADLQAIGRILLQLAQRRHLSEEDPLILPILPSPEWKSVFGRDADRWLALCNQLLDPNLSLEDLNLDKLRAELEALRYKPPISPQLAVGIAAGILLLASVVLFFSIRSKSGRVSITSDPSGARVFIQGKTEYEPKLTPFVIKLPKGPYTFRAEYPGLTNQTMEVVVQGGRNPTNHFAFPYGRVHIATVPETTKFEFKGKPVWTNSPFESGVLPPGEVTYYVRAPNYNVMQVTVTVPADRSVTNQQIALEQAAADAGEIELTSRPLNVNISEGSENFGETPLRRTLAPGAHTLTLKFEDWDPVTKTITIAKGATTNTEFSLPYGFAQFSIQPADANIFLNNRPAGQLDRNRRKILRPGNYDVRIEHEGYYFQTNRFAIKDGETTTVNASLIPALGVVAFSSDPPGAAIFTNLNTEPLGKTANSNELALPFADGIYSFTARYPGLKDLTINDIAVRLGTNRTLSFPFAYATVEFTTTPPGAKVLVGGVAVAETPWTNFVAPGSVRYRLEKDDYVPQELLVSNLHARTVLPLPRTLRRTSVQVALRSDPPGAHFFEANTELQSSNGFWMPWGTHTITAKYAGLEDVSTNFEARPRQENKLDFAFDFGVVIPGTNISDLVTVKLSTNQTVVFGGIPPQTVLPPANYTFVLSDDDQTERVSLTVLSRQTNSLVSLTNWAGTIKDSIGMQLVKIPGLVADGKTCYAGKYEVTQEEFETVMHSNPSEHKGPRHPVDSVSWDQAVQFCKLLTQKEATSSMKIYGTYRLPTRAEWRIYAKGSDYSDAVRGKEPADVGTKKPNPQRLYDVLGNVWEWLNETDADGSFLIGTGYHGSFNRTLEQVEHRDKIRGQEDVGFRVLFVPAATTPTARNQ